MTMCKVNPGVFFILNPKRLNEFLELLVESTSSSGSSLGIPKFDIEVIKKNIATNS